MGNVILKITMQVLHSLSYFVSGLWSQTFRDIIAHTFPFQLSPVQSMLLALATTAFLVATKGFVASELAKGPKRSGNQLSV